MQFQTASVPVSLSRQREGPECNLVIVSFGQLYQRMARKAYLALFMLVCVTVLTHCFGQETKTETKTTEIEKPSTETEIVLSIPTLFLSPWELHVLSDMTLGIAAMQCPAAKQPTISSMKLYIRERVKHAGESQAEFQNRGVLPVYTNLVKCYDRLVAGRDRPIIKLIGPVGTEKDSPASTANPKLTQETTIRQGPGNRGNVDGHSNKDQRVKNQKVKAHQGNSEPEDTYSIWSTIQRAIENFTRYLSIRHKRSTDEAPKPESTTSEPKKVEDRTTTQLETLKISSTEGYEQKLSPAQKPQKQFSEILLSMVSITSNTCLAEEAKEQVKFYEQAMREVLYWISSDESLSAAVQEFQIERLLGSMNTCSSKSPTAYVAQAYK